MTELLILEIITALLGGVVGLTLAIAVAANQRLNVLDKERLKQKQALKESQEDNIKDMIQRIK